MPFASQQQRDLVASLDADDRLHIGTLGRVVQELQHVRAVRGMDDPSGLIDLCIETVEALIRKAVYGDIQREHDAKRQ